MTDENRLLVMKLLGDDTRHRICKFIAEKAPINVMPIAVHMGLSQSATSQHLTLLRRANIITSEAFKQQRFYSIAVENKELVEQFLMTNIESVIDTGDYYLTLASPTSLVINSGDNIPKKEISDAKLIELMGVDASKWAKEFNKRVNQFAQEGIIVDEGFVIGWFANAIENAKDFGRKVAIDKAINQLQRIKSG